MGLHFRTQRRSASFFLLVILSVFLLSAVPAAESRDMLLHIVTDCLDVNARDYCGTCLAPRTGTSCVAGRECKATTEVWAESAEYVVIRDRKMCGCPSDFVHGLAIPISRVRGIEDPQKPDGIWDFAWSEAKKRIPDESSIGLAVNPSGKRSQDQLHIHIVRLQDDTRQRLTGTKPLSVPTLDAVWKAAAKKAAEEHLDDYGVLVAKNPKNGFLVLVEEQSPEKAYTLWKCR